MTDQGVPPPPEGLDDGRAVQFSSCEGCAIAMRVEGAVFGLKTSLPVIGKA